MKVVFVSDFANRSSHLEGAKRILQTLASLAMKKAA